MEETSQSFDLNWFCRFPRPKITTCDSDSEFSSEFETLIESHGAKTSKHARRNP